MTTRLHVLCIDNFDSFVFNLTDELAQLGADVTVVRNDVDVERLLALAIALPKPRLLLLSPGPGRPADAGALVELTHRALGKLPVFGVCLGHQALVEVLGGVTSSARDVVHGKTSELEILDDPLFANCRQPIRVARYHSLIAKDLPNSLRCIAHVDDMPMAVASREHAAWGVQFHPESILTPSGRQILANVVELAIAAELASAPADGAPLHLSGKAAR